jgi:hypothetical protein
VRASKEAVQLGLTKSEINGVWRQLQRLLKDVDSGKVTTF